MLIFSYIVSVARCWAGPQLAIEWVTQSMHMKSIALYINIELSMLRPNMILYFHPSTLKHYSFPHKASFPKLFVPVSNVYVRMQHALLGFCWNSALKFCYYLGPHLVFWDTAVKLGSTWKTLWYWTVGGTGTVSLKGFCWVAPKEAPSWDFRRWWKPQVHK